MWQRLKERAKALKTDIPALYLALKDPGTPLFAKLLAGVTVAYALSPIDLVPDFIPVLGYLDDVLLLPLLVWLSVRLIPPDILVRCRQEAQGLWEGRPKRWIYAIGVVVIWLIILGVIIRAVLRK